jgi:hypothetical protein
MKLIVYWAVLLVIGFLMPSSFATPFMVGSCFGIVWTLWMTDLKKLHETIKNL